MSPNHPITGRRGTHRAGRHLARTAAAGLVVGVLALGTAGLPGPTDVALAAPSAQEALPTHAKWPGYVPLVETQADTDVVHFSKHPTEQSTYAKNTTLRLNVQAESTDGSALTYQWKWSTSADKSNAANVTGLDGSDTRAVLTATTPSSAGTYYYWAEVTAGDVTAPSNVGKVVVVDKTLADSLSNGDFEEFVSTTTGVSVPAPLGYQGGTWDGKGTSNGNVTVSGSYSGGALNGKNIFIEREESFLSGATNAVASAWFHPETNVVGWHTTHDSKYSNTNFNTTLYGLIPGSIIQISPEYNYTHTSEEGYGGWSDEHHFVAELAADKNSSLYQEIATVPGKVYEWSLDHASTLWGTGTNIDNIMAVVIGPAINSEADYAGGTDYWNKASTTAGPSNGGTFPYGINTYTPFNDMVTQLADQLAVDASATNNLVELGANHSGEDLAVTYNGATYYVYVSSDPWADHAWSHRTGSYSVPEGQGTTVFAFVSIVAKSGATGNALDNIVFASGAAPDNQQEVTYSGDSAVKAVSTKEGYAYALVELRGSTVYPLQERDVWYTPSGSDIEDPATINPEVGDGVSWYTPGAGGLSFKNLVPGKTYRLIGLPLGAISTALGTNVAPADVFDEGYYVDTTVKAGKNDALDGTGPNLSASLYNAAGSGETPSYQGRITLAATDSRAEYALLTKDANQQWVPVDATGQALTATAPANAADWRAGTGATLAFSGLEPGRSYRLIARPAGYTELTWSVVAANTDSGVIEIVIPEPGKDVTATNVSRASSGSADVLTLTGVDAAVTYHVLDATSGQQLWQDTGQTGYTITLTGAGCSASCSTARTLQVLAEIAGTFTQGVRVYPGPQYAGNALAIDYVAEAAGLDTGAGYGPVPARVEYVIAETQPVGGYVAGTGSQKIALTALIDGDGFAGTSIWYRLVPEATYDGEYVQTVSQLAIPVRPAPTGDPVIDWQAETIDTVPFTTLGYTGYTDLPLQFSDPAVAGASFRSQPKNYTLKARPAAPADLGGSVDSGTFTVSNLQAGRHYEQSLTADGPWSTVTDAGDGTSVLGGSAVWYLRFAPDPDTFTPASWTIKVSDWPLGIDMVQIQALTYGYSQGQADAAVHAVTILNKAGSATDFPDKSINLQVKDVQKDGVSYDGQVFELNAGSATMPVLQPFNPANTTDENSSLFNIRPVTGLAAGTYTATLLFRYRDTTTDNDADQIGHWDHAEAQVVLRVDKATWSFTAPTAELAADGNQLTVHVTAGKPADPASGAAAAVLDLWVGDGAPASGGSSDQATFNGLAWATQYAVWAQVTGDANHLPSAAVKLADAWTDYQPATAVFGSGGVLSANFNSEQLLFQKTFLPADWLVTIGGQTVGANADLSGFVDDAAGTTFAVNVARAGVAGADADPTVGPGSSSTVTGTLPGRRPAPTKKSTANPSGVISTVPAEAPSRPTGKIVEAGGSAIEYRVGGSAGAWTLASNGAATGVAYGTYEVRYPATSSDFASAAADKVLVNFANNEFALTWDATPAEAADATGSAFGTVTDISWDEPVVNGSDVIGSHQIQFLASTDEVTGGFYRWSWTNSAVAEPIDPIVTTVPSHSYTWTASAVAHVGLTVEAFYPRTLAFDANGATGEVAALANTEMDPDYDVTVPGPAGLSRSGYTFMGWNTAQNGSGLPVAADSAFTMDGTTGYSASVGSQTLYAQWASSAAQLLSLADEQVIQAGGTGAQGDPYTAAITVPNNVLVVPGSTADVSADATAGLFTDAGYTVAGSLALPDAGKAYHAYVKVTAADGTTVTFWDIAVTRAKSDDKTLFSVGGQAFVAGTTAYTVPYGVSRLAVGPAGNVLVAATAGATVGGGASQDLTVGANPVTIVVTAEDGSTATYNLTVTRAPSGEVRLVAVGGAEVQFANPGEDGSSSSASTPVAGTAAPDASVTEISPANLATKTDSGAVASLWNSDFTIQVTDPVMLTPGSPQVVYVKVASDLATAYYAVTVTRDLSHDTSLYDVAGLAIDAGTSPIQLAVPYAVSQITAADVVSAANATVTVTGAPVALVPGAKTPVEIKVTAQDGTTETTYQLEVYRAAAPNRAPIGVEPLPPVSVQAGQAVTVAVAAVATDPDGDSLYFNQLTAGPDAGVATVKFETAQLTVTGVKAGATTIKVTVTDGKGVVNVVIPVTVTAAPTPSPSPSPTPTAKPTTAKPTPKPTATTTAKPTPSATATGPAKPGYQPTFSWFTLSPDLTGDGLGEILAINSANGALLAYPVNPSGSLAPAKTLVASGLSGHRVYCPGDWEGDGQADVITVDPGGVMWLYSGDGQGGVGRARQIGRGWSGYRVVPSGDLTRDGKPDLLAIDQAGRLWVYESTGYGGFKPGRIAAGHGWVGLDLHAAGDLTGDGKADILMIDSSGRLFAYAGRGNGTFQPGKQVGQGWVGLTLASGADLSGEGLADIVGRTADGKLFSYRGRGNGTFTAAKHIGSGW
ncbi:MAG: FG-GAP-like repeat-containing protein [Bifidobacteriaceae bacterium]|jgi:uncharacterized repeat protein (TIGR02543 family)|nr:FG-GAP-like repeat-containing protein [Bifidobacteriaceae bacterium]